MQTFPKLKLPLAKEIEAEYFHKEEEPAQMIFYEDDGQFYEITRWSKEEWLRKPIKDIIRYIRVHREQINSSLWDFWWEYRFFKIRNSIEKEESDQLFYEKFFSPVIIKTVTV